MRKTKTGRKLLPSDVARYLNDDAAVTEYMNAVPGSGGPDPLLLALGDIARARGMAQIAKDTGLVARAPTRPWPRVPSPGSIPSSRWAWS